MAITQEGRIEATSETDIWTDALIKEARKRQHRRWLLVIGIIVIIAMIVSGVSYAIVSRPSARARHTGTSSPSKTTPAQSGPFVSPMAPYALAVAPNGDLLVVDSGRDQILRRLPSGKFQALAGDGKRGFSGDGGQAVHAEINVQSYSGIAVAKDGTIYFADSGNGRVREVLPNGIIKTVAGGGRRTPRQGAMPALTASLKEVAGLTIGPNAELYVAANFVYRLGAGGTLYWVVGKNLPMQDWPKNWGGVYSNPAIQQDFNRAARIAFDGHGDLLVVGGGAYGVYEMARSRKLRFVGVFRGDAGGLASLAEGTAGSVVLAYNFGLYRFSPSGSIKLISPSAATGAYSPLSVAISQRHHKNGFITGDGVAVANNGDIFVDTNVGNAWTSVGAIVELRPNGSVVLLWKS